MAARGKLFIIGLGPGDVDHLTPAARTALEQADTVVGYRTYLDQIQALVDGKRRIASGMRQEIERCRQALQAAASGATVALVSGGDAGIYGMAGLALELAEDATIEIEVIPGISALQAAAARLGAPLMHDFAVISLSDLLTPWAVISRRLRAVAAADFVVVLYNPRSTQRRWQLAAARDLLLAERSPRTPVGVVRHACRPGEEVQIATLETLPVDAVDMFSIVIVGNASTYLSARGAMVTRRGYLLPEGRPGRSEPNCCARGETATGEDRAAGRSTRTLFVGGTGSDVGKSVLVAGLCRLLRRDGIAVAPFKAQNMALNSAVTPEGAEIGRAQALQAFACGLAAHADMNPILLKPNSDTGSQVIVQGRPVGNMTVNEYHVFKPQAWSAVTASLARLRACYQVVVMEGAGSIAEINLKDQDITNLKVAAHVDAPVLLIADIDRGGVFASLVGTLELLDPDERARVSGIIINRFRGDKSLLEAGLAELERRCGVPVLGVVPWIDLRLPEEDSVALARKPAHGRSGAWRIGVVRLPRMSNYTDFDVLEREPGVALSYLTRPEQVAGQDLIILPGSKSVMADLDVLHGNGMARALQEYHAGGGKIVGICGGFQMLGQTLYDPAGVESDRTEMAGLGLLAVTTILGEVKQTHLVVARPLAAASLVGLDGVEQVTGYEIHMGTTDLHTGARPLLRLTERSGQLVELVDGAVSDDGRVWGTYLHGLFDDGAVRRALLSSWTGAVASEELCQATFLETEIDRLADHLAAHLDLDRIRALIGLAAPGTD